MWGWGFYLGRKGKEGGKERIDLGGWAESKEGFMRNYMSK